MAFALFMASPLGRGLRIVAGLILMALGIFWLGNLGGWILAAVGLVPLAAGVFDVCLFAPLFGAPLSGREVRQGRIVQR
ncbi:MAG TPA: DUF2892 domain-containing protein [Chloroflexia bacterium]|nr:DUF2892 domain-containing protein [Chloroflexia bacterium]